MVATAILDRLNGQGFKPPSKRERTAAMEALPPEVELKIVLNGDKPAIASPKPTKAKAVKRDRSKAIKPLPAPKEYQTLSLRGEKYVREGITHWRGQGASAERRRRWVQWFEEGKSFEDLFMAEGISRKSAIQLLFNYGFDRIKLEAAGLYIPPRQAKATVASTTRHDRWQDLVENHGYNVTQLAKHEKLSLKATHKVLRELFSLEWIEQHNVIRKYTRYAVVATTEGGESHRFVSRLAAVTWLGEKMPIPASLKPAIFRKISAAIETGAIYQGYYWRKD